MKYVIVANYSYYITGLIIAMLLLLNYLDMAWRCRVSCFDNFEHLGREVHTGGGELTDWQAGTLTSSFLLRGMCFALS